MRKKSGSDLDSVSTTKINERYQLNEESTTDNKIGRQSQPVTRSLINSESKKRGSFYYHMNHLEIGENHFENDEKNRIEWKIYKSKTSSGPIILSYFGKWLFEAACLEVTLINKIIIDIGIG